MEYTRFERISNHLHKLNSVLINKISVELESENPNCNVIDSCIEEMDKIFDKLFKIHDQMRIRDIRRIRRLKNEL